MEYLCHFFHISCPRRSVESALALYERNIDIYETKYVEKKEVWAAACYFLDAQLRKSKLSFKEIAAAFFSDGEKVEPKRISRAVEYIKLHESENDANKSVLHSQETGNLSSVSRLASVFGMSFKQEKVARRIVQFIDEEELILGLNPLSILSVAFFLTLSLTAEAEAFESNVPGFVKQTLSDVSTHVQIAQNTIRKGIRDVRDEVLTMVQQQRKGLKVQAATIRHVLTWEI